MKAMYKYFPDMVLSSLNLTNKFDLFLLFCGALFKIERLLTNDVCLYFADDDKVLH